MMSGIQKDGEVNFSMIKDTHHGIKCNQCKKEPIVGFRYKCHICDDYNLCEICEQKNSETQEHNHNFIKIRKSEKKEEIKPKENKPPEKVIDINKIEEKKEYNYESEEKVLKIDAKEFEDKEVSFVVLLKNIGNLQWPGNGKTQLINDNNSDIKSNNFKLKALKNGENQDINIKLKLDNMKAGEKKCIFHFSVEGKNYGEPLILNVNIKENENVIKMRNEFGLSQKEYDSKRLLEALKKTNNDSAKAFDSLFN